MSHTVPDGARRHRLTDEYQRMGEVGILAPDAYVELIDGEIIDMPPIGFTHSGTVDRLTRILVTACGDRAIVRVQSSIRLGRYSEPDFALLRPRNDFYTTGHAAPDDVLLGIEVAATSQRYDREVKLPLQARHGIPEFWLVDLKAGALWRHRKPSANRYSESDEPNLEAALSIEALPGVAFELSSLFS